MAFITFEGIEGSGKTTQLRRLAALCGAGTVVTREPGGTPIGRAIRGVLLDPANAELSQTAELLLYFADRAQHVAEVVRPALAAGRLVLCDRYVESSLAYQGYGRGLALESIRRLATLATGDLSADLVVLLDVPAELGLRRVERRGQHDRLERERLEFHERVRAGFLALLEAEPSRWLRLDGTASEDEVFGSLHEGLASRGLLPGAGR